MELERSSGILLHPTSLPGPFGVGDLGPAARAFARWLREAGQSWWQVLPLGPTGYGNSPYMSLSAHGGNPLLVSPEDLRDQGLLDANDVELAAGAASERVDYGRAQRTKAELIARSFARLERGEAGEHRAAFHAFRERHAEWLDELALFLALKHMSGERAWIHWAPQLRDRDPDALQEASQRLRREVELHAWAQYLFFRQWDALRAFARELGVRLIGDLPIYVAHDSAWVWREREPFQLDARGAPLAVAGVPPDYFSAEGQLWGSPLYRWEVHARDGFRWWIERFRAILQQVDLVRIDHFRGFEAYWEIPADDPRPAHGRWVKAPGEELFAALRDALGDLPVIAEDLGVITPEVDELRDRFELPGMRVLQMAFGTDPLAHLYRPHHFAPRSAVYTATHDHNTTVGWFRDPPGSATTQTPEEVAAERAHVLRYLGSDGARIHWDLIRLALGSVAALAIFPLQDVLGLGSQARMNRPGTLEGNWEWRARPGALDGALAARLRAETELFDRLPR